jgi:hypothetical protein
MSFSSQFEGLRENAYSETREMAEELELADHDAGAVRIELVQTWIIITCYELLRAEYHRAWLSAGRVFRLVQALRLHEVDGPHKAREPGNLDRSEQRIEVEEHRRAFWFAYCLDRFINVHNPLPLTLCETDVRTTTPPAMYRELCADMVHPSFTHVCLC